VRIEECVKRKYMGIKRKGDKLEINLREAPREGKEIYKK
jgi:hypothetical protein